MAGCRFNGHLSRDTFLGFLLPVQAFDVVQRQDSCFFVQLAGLFLIFFIEFGYFISHGNLNPVFFKFRHQLFAEVCADCMISSQLAAGCSDQIFQDISYFSFHRCFLPEFLDEIFHFQSLCHFFPVGFITIAVRLDDHNLTHNIVFLACVFFQLR